MNIEIIRLEILKYLNFVTLLFIPYITWEVILPIIYSLKLIQMFKCIVVLLVEWKRMEPHEC